MESFEDFSLYESSAATEDMINSLNLLLDNLDIPIEIESPYDLTPSLLLAILESTLKSRLPLSDKLRTASSPQSKVESIKVFLGVLGHDVLQRDLSSIDPRRLARGEFKEVAYVGGLLVQVAKQSGMLSQDREEVIDVDPESSYSDSIIDHFNQLRLGETPKVDRQGDEEEYEPSFDTSADTSTYSGDLLKTPPQVPMYLRFQMEMDAATTTPRGNPLSPRDMNAYRSSPSIGDSSPISPTYRSPLSGSYSSRQPSSQTRFSPVISTPSSRKNATSINPPQSIKPPFSTRSTSSSSSSLTPDRSSTPPPRHLPEKESTPPTAVKSRLYMGYKPSPVRPTPGSSSPISSPTSSSSPPVYIRTPKQRSVHWIHAPEEEEEEDDRSQQPLMMEHSTCSCTMAAADDETASTVHCHCEIHGYGIDAREQPIMNEEPRYGSKQKPGDVYKGPPHRDHYYSGSTGRRANAADFITRGGPMIGNSEGDGRAGRGLMGASPNRTTTTQKGNDGGAGGSLTSRVRSRETSSLRQSDARLADEFFQLKATRTLS